MQEGTTTAPSASEPDAFLAHEHIAGLLERLRRVHVLNGKHVRSYGADFIRDL